MERQTKAMATYANKKAACSAKFDDIHAIQLLPKKMIGKNQHYRFELNIVLKNSNRVHVVDYSGTRGIDTDAKALSLFLGKPVWDAISPPSINWLVIFLMQKQVQQI